MAVEVTGGLPYKVVVIDHNGNVVGPDHPLIAGEGWKVQPPLSDVGVGNNKTFIVPANTEYQILAAYVTYTSTATVGNRQLAARIFNHLGALPADLARAAVVQTASLARNYLFAPGVADLLGFRDTNYLTTPIPVSTILGPGQMIRFIDNANVDVADTLAVTVYYASRSVA